MGCDKTSELVVLLWGFCFRRHVQPIHGVWADGTWRSHTVAEKQRSTIWRQVRDSTRKCNYHRVLILRFFYFCSTSLWCYSVPNDEKQDVVSISGSLPGRIIAASIPQVDLHSFRFWLRFHLEAVRQISTACERGWTLLWKCFWQCAFQNLNDNLCKNKDSHIHIISIAVVCS